MSLSQDRGSLRYERRFAFGFEGAILFPLEAYKDLKSVFDEFHQRDEYTVTLKRGSGAAR